MNGIHGQLVRKRTGLRGAKVVSLTCKDASTHT